MIVTRCRLLALALFTASPACREGARSQAPLVKSAELGVFFGGQVQEREQIPLELDRAKQTQGFRIELRAPATRPIPVRWEIDVPGYTKGVRDEKGQIGKGRMVRLGDATLVEGQARLDQTVQFEPGDPLGIWNVRVLVDGALVIDRAFEVYDPRARARALARDAGP